jgi:hypothetical protein
MRVIAFRGCLAAVAKSAMLEPPGVIIEENVLCLHKLALECGCTHFLTFKLPLGKTSFNTIAGKFLSDLAIIFQVTQCMNYLPK